MLKNLYAKKVLMIRPTSFFFNTQTSGDNAFMTPSTETVEQTTNKAQLEFDTMRKQLESVGVEVVTFD